ncbi:hypothetical protein IT157_07185 [bacterium]|nr:hypothetical protein [bacterium]
MTAIRDWRTWLGWWSLQVPSLRAIVKYAPEGFLPLIPVYLIGTFFLTYWFIHKFRATRIAQWKWLPLTLLLLHTSLNAVVYPKADALKFVGRGSPQDDALMVGAERLVQGLNPYEGETFRHEWVSAGPGWIVLALPFTLTGLFALFTPFWVALCAWWIARRYDTPSASLFLILLFSSLVFWELSVTGSDMLAMGCAFLLSLVVLDWSGTRGFVAKFLSALFAASVTTSRIVFAFLLPLQAAFLYHRKKRDGIFYGLLAILLFVLFQLPFYLWNSARFFPLTRFAWAKGMLGTEFEILAAVTTILVLIYAAMKKGRLQAADTGSLKSCLSMTVLTLLVTMFWSALGDLKAREFDLALWEGANYFGPLIPAAVVLAIAEKSKIENRKSNNEKSSRHRS